MTVRLSIIPDFIEPASMPQAQREPSTYQIAAIMPFGQRLPFSGVAELKQKTPNFYRALVTMVCLMRLKAQTLLKHGCTDVSA